MTSGSELTPDEPNPPSIIWSATLIPEVANLNAARTGLGRALKEVGLPQATIDDALLVVNEMTSNAVRHARTEFTVSAAVVAGKLRLEVFDRDTRPPALLGLDQESTSGRGLHLVSAIASDWGWRTAEDGDGVSGKLVWAELALDGPPTRER